MLDDACKVLGIKLVNLQSLGIDLSAHPPWKQGAILVDEDDFDGLMLHEDGTRKARLPRAPFQWWVDSDGNITPLVLSTNRDAVESFDHKYSQAARSTHRRRGWVPFYELDDEGVTYLVNGQPVLADGVLEEIAKRRAKAKARGARYENLARDKSELLAEAMTKGTSEAINRLSSAVEKTLDPEDRKRPKRQQGEQ